MQGLHPFLRLGLGEGPGEHFNFAPQALLLQLLGENRLELAQLSVTFVDDRRRHGRGGDDAMVAGGIGGLLGLSGGRR